MTGTPSRTARVPTARWDLKEAVGKAPNRGTRTAYEARRRGRGSVGFRNPMSSKTVARRCGGPGAKVTRLTLGDLRSRQQGQALTVEVWAESRRSQQRAETAVAAAAGPNEQP